MLARFPGTCYFCNSPIHVGEEIEKQPGRGNTYGHAACLPASSRYQRAGWRVEVVESNSVEYPVGSFRQYVHKGVAESTLASAQANIERLQRFYPDLTVRYEMRAL